MIERLSTLLSVMGQKTLALALAEAEARFGLAEQALRNFVAGELARPGVIEVVPDDPGSLRGRAVCGWTRDARSVKDPGCR